jgi:hypothetical protein
MLNNHRACGARVDDEDWIRATAGWLTEQWDAEAWQAYRELGLSDEDWRILREAALDVDLPRLTALSLEECELWVERELDKMAEARAAAAAEE